MDLFWLRVAAVFYAAAAVAVFPAVLRQQERWRRSCVHLAGLGAVFHFVSAVEMLAQAHRWVPSGMREVESWMGLALVGLFFLIWWLYEGISLGIFALPMTFLLVLVPALGREHYSFPSPGVRTGWLIVHILALMTAYAALGLSMASSLLYLLQERKLKNKLKFLPGAIAQPEKHNWLPSLDSLDRSAVAMLVLGFPAMTIGLALGSVLMQEAGMGAAYYLDPRILSAFMSWIVYAALFLLRRVAGVRGRRAALLTTASFAIMLVVWVANLFSHIHRYGAQ